MMKKSAIFLALILMVSTPSFAVNLLDQVIYKEVVLTSNRSTVLVNRITGQVKYLRFNNGKWITLTGGLKNKYQSMYEVQTSSKPTPVLDSQ